jgi:hypothetical protein
LSHDRKVRRSYGGARQSPNKCVGYPAVAALEDQDRG